MDWNTIAAFLGESWSRHRQDLQNFLFHIAPALVTVIGGTFIIQRKFVRRANASSFIDALLGELDTIQDLSLEYWNSDLSTAAKKKEATVIGQKLKGGMMTINDELEHFYQHYRKRFFFFKGKVDGDCVKLMAELFMAATGGEFEVKNRKPDPSRYMVVVPAVSKVRSLLRRTKL